MLRIVEVLGSLAEKDLVAHAWCLSLNDATERLRQNPVIPADVQVWGANRSKVKLSMRALFWPPTLDVLFVGHLSLSPLAQAMQLLGHIRRYYVVLHGIEAWKRVSHIDRVALNAAAGIITTTSYTAQVCARHNELPIDHFRVIPLCADERQVDPSPGFKLAGKFKLLCVARMDASERYKGFEYIFEALAILRPTSPDIHLNMVGTGNDIGRLSQVADCLGVSQQITFWGALSDEDLAAAYGDCDVFVMPSKKEGFGIVFLEAMRYAKPCIGGNHGGTPEVIEHGENGYLVEYGNAQALATYIQHLRKSDAIRTEMGSRGLAVVKEQCSKAKFEKSFSRMILMGRKELYRAYPGMEV